MPPGTNSGIGQALLQVCVFDQRRGLQEGEEHDKILFFHPAATPKEEQQSVVGLSEGLIVFSRIFEPNAPCETVDTERHKHVMVECEPHIWMVMVVEKASDKPNSRGIESHLREGALRAILVEAHDLFCLFFGQIRPLIDSSIDRARSALAALLPDYLAHFVGGGRKPRLPTTGENLWQRGTIQQMPLNRHTHLAVQSLRGMLETAFGGGVVRYTMLLYENQLVFSSLPQEATAILYVYCLLRMVPSVVKSSTTTKPGNGLWLSRASGQSHTSSAIAAGGTHGVSGEGQLAGQMAPPTNTHTKTPALRSLFHNPRTPIPHLGSQQNPTDLPPLHSSLSTPSSSRNPTPGTLTPPTVNDTPSSSSQPTPCHSPPPDRTSLSPVREPEIHSDPHDDRHMSPSRQPLFSLSSSLLPHPLHPNAWWKTPDGFLESDAWGAGEGRGGETAPLPVGGEGGSSGRGTGPVVRIAGGEGEGELQLCAYQGKGVTLLMLLPVGALEGGVASSLLRGQLLGKLVQGVARLEEALAGQWGGPTASHIPSCRYLFFDRASHIIRASPRVKVNTLSKESLAALNQVRSEVDERHRRDAACGHASRTKQDAGREVCARGSNNAWVMVRSNADAELYMVLEKASDTLLLASEAVEKINQRHFEGMFSSD